MTDRPPLPQDIWEALSPDAQAAVSALVAAFEQRIANLEERLNTNSTNSSKPPSSDTLSVKRRPPTPPSGKKRGGQPGHRRRVRALVPSEQLRKLVFGPRLRAVLSVLVGAYRLGKRPVQQLVFDLLGLSISLGMIARLERQGAAELEAPVEELRRHVRDAASAHIDETSWWQRRTKAWLWAAVTDLVTVFTIAPSRGAEVAKAMLGTAAGKVVISDRFKG
jgi:Transposase IS66 family/Family of unknown function (DUF6444)